jgi:hypothetical protein
MDYQKIVRMAICINNAGYEDDLKVRMVYTVLPDESAARSQYVRIIDETEEDYLYPESYFVFIDVPEKIEQTLRVPIRTVNSKITLKKRRKASRKSSKIIA